MNAPTLDDEVAAGGPGARRRRKKLWWIVGVVALVVLLVIGLRYRAAQSVTATARFGTGGPLAVGVAKVSTGDVPITVNALGTVTPLATVTVHPQINGPLIKIAFIEGQIVKAGELLALIDPRPFQAALDQAQRQLKRDQALLANAKIKPRSSQRSSIWAIAASLHRWPAELVCARWISVICFRPIPARSPS